ncbi:HNH endonuclease [Blautia sp. MSJ-19]|uniref:HNH endonuclease n=1 Tax=Blautia sp. MSJ-19 TaxID=2841517 RepID=UPI001C0EFB90|nr:HNH endonuclease [Blautia sp. MSJ-19]MBU5480006.1 HNH endonuclease [Blautia sp. MSJ-19]
MKMISELKVGQILRNTELVDTFQCDKAGDMRNSKIPGILVIISDYTKGMYHDKWIGGVLHYAGEGLKGDQDIQSGHNAVLAESSQTGTEVYLFEAMEMEEYIFCGRVELTEEPYTEIQPGEDGVPRNVWKFPVRPVADSEVRKPQMFVFEDMEDYKKRGKEVDAAYVKLMEEKKRNIYKSPYASRITVPQSGTDQEMTIPQDIVGRNVKHKKFGTGTITAISGASIEIAFAKAGTKKLGYEFCMRNKMLEFL